MNFLHLVRTITPIKDKLPHIHRAAGFSLAALFLIAPGLFSEPADGPDSRSFETVLEKSVLPARPTTGSDNPVNARGLAHSFGRIQLQLTGNWQSQSSQTTMVLRSPDFPLSQIMIVEPARPATWSISGYLSQGIAGMEKAGGQQPLRSWPAQPREGFTQKGYGFAFQARITRNSQGQILYNSYYALSAGAVYQAVVVQNKNQQEFEALIKLVGSAVDGAAIQIPAGPGVQTQRGQAFSFFNYDAVIPANWKREEGAMANQAIFRVANLPGSQYVFGKTNNFIAEMELQPARPVSPVFALQNYLIQRSHLYKKYYDSGRLQKYNPKVAGIYEGRLPNGMQYTGLYLHQDSDDRFYLGAWLLSGPQMSLIVASGFKFFRYDLIKRNSKAALDHQHWLRYLGSLPAVLASVRWQDSRIRRDANAEKFLAQKKTLRYHRERSIVSGDISFASSNTVKWDFLPQGQVKLFIDKFRSFNVYEFNHNTGQNDWSAGYLTNNVDTKNNTYQVWRAPEASYIVVMRPAGIASFHVLNSQSPLTIDGFRDGCCR
ncbi:MAG: hypothetical protein KDK39_07280 [Leptospiraceae bacterium]|nr:hypothetical protein [Leptospiraceae bacterium]